MSFKKLFVRLSWVGMISVGFAFSTVAMAQVTTARLEGFVRDPAGLVIPGVPVVATHEGTNMSTETLSNETGFFVFPRLQPGPYTVTAELAGFKRSINTGILLEVGDTKTLNVNLETGDLTETVTVTADVATVDTVSTAVSSVVSTQQIETLPLVSRDPLSLFYLQPGTNRSTGGGIVDGTRALSANVTVDGIGATEPALGQGATSSAAPTLLEAVDEYRVVTSSASAEYGRGAGAQVQMIYKSGTNEFHGSMFNFHRNKALNAGEFFVNKIKPPPGQETQTKPTFIRNQFGASVGGPIIKDKLFFHFTYEGTREKTDETRNELVYTNQFKQGGVFRYCEGQANSGSMVNLDGSPKPAYADCVRTIDLTQIDSTRLGKDPSGLFDQLVGSFPAPNNFDIGDGFNTGGFTYLSDEPLTENQWVVKGDYQLNNEHRVGVSYANRHYDSKGYFMLNGARSSANIQAFPTGVVSLNSSFTPTVLNEFRVGGTKRDNKSENPDPDRFNPEGIVIFAGLGGPARGHPKNYFLPQYFRHATITVADNLTWIRGNHSLKGGMDIRINRANVMFGGDLFIPVIDTTGNAANVPSLPGLASADRSRAQQLTNDITGTLGRLRQDYNANDKTSFTPFDTKYRLWRSREYSFFFQDTWKFKPNLTLNLGFRWEIMPAHFEAQGLYAYPVGRVAGLYGISGPSGATKLEFAPNYGKDTYKTDWNNFAPNVGFNWDPFNDGKWSISGNYRIAYDRIWLATSLFIDNSQEGTFTGRTYFGQSGDRLTDLPGMFDPTLGYFDPGPIFGDKPFNRQGTVTAMDDNYYIPYTGSWSFRIQREIMRNTALNVSYVGNKATGLARAPDWNQLEIRKNGFLNGFLAAQKNLAASGDPMVGSDTGVFGQIWNVMSAVDRNSQRTNIANGQVATVANFIDASRASSGYLEAADLPLNFFRLNPQFSTVYPVGNNSNSNWHGMKVELTRRFSEGIQFNLNYTWGKGLTDYEGGQSQRNPYRDNENRGLDKHVNSSDSAHVWNANFIWEVPIGSGRRWLNAAHPVIDGILGGWQLNGILHYASGDPFTIDSDRYKLTIGDQSTADCANCKPDMTSKVIRGDQIRALTDQEKELFSDPPAGSAGQLAEYFFRRSPYWVVDSSIFKQFPLRFIPGEQGSLQFRFEFFNTFNNVVFDEPSTGITSGSFGIISNDRNDPRIIQVALKLIF